MKDQAQVVIVGGGIVGAQIGFSPGELLDWLLGWFGADIAGDDGDLRDMKQYWVPVLQPAPPPEADEAASPPPEKP